MHGKIKLFTSLEIKESLDFWAKEVEENAFIEFDPVQIPHRYSRAQDIEISGFFAAIMAWGQRKTIIKSAKKLMLMMDDSPYDFITQCEKSDLKSIESFQHRTLSGEDVIAMVLFFKSHYISGPTLETLFFNAHSLAAPMGNKIHAALIEFQNAWQRFPHPKRTDKHIASPAKGSACKRLNMYLRWMVRKQSPVDFGIWKSISAAELMCPLDVHVQRIAIEMGLLKRNKPDWHACKELTEELRKFRPDDPVYYDYALFGIGVTKLK